MRDAKAHLEEITGVEAGSFEELAELPTLYVNNVDMSFTAFDMRMTLGENLGPEAGTLRIKRRVKVFMSLEHAKVFSRLLSNAINQFEAAAGQEIPLFTLTDPTAKPEQAK
jgi:hypothetical protein